MPIKKKVEVIKPDVLSTEISAKAKKENTKSSKSTVSSRTQSSSTTTKTKSAASKTSSSTKSTAKKNSNKKTAASNSKKNAATKKVTVASSDKKAVATKKVAAISSEKKVATKKTASQKSTVKKSTTKKNSSISKKQVPLKKPRIEVVEYYDLPYRYNQTLVKVLYQTPTTLFIYWDISENERIDFTNQYGENFFNDTRPVLVIHNDTMHYSFEIEIDDFANSWYLHVNDSNCKYNVELGRRPKYYGENKSINLPNDYFYVTNSNEIEAPNDHVLFNKNIDVVYFKDVKTNIVTAESVTSLSFLRNMGKLYSLFDLHTNFDEENMSEGKRLQLNLNNPTSGNPTSKFK